MAKKIFKHKEENWFRIILALGVVLIILFYFTNIYTSGNRKECPYSVQGNPEADFVIKYIDSPYCTWCWFQEPILKKAVKEKGDSFKLEKYDIRYCSEIVNQYRFSGTPSFVFVTEEDKKEFSSTGFIPEKNFFGLICEVTGDC